MFAYGEDLQLIPIWRVPPQAELLLTSPLFTITYYFNSEATYG